MAIATGHTAMLHLKLHLYSTELLHIRRLQHVNITASAAEILALEWINPVSAAVNTDKIKGLILAEHVQYAHG
jgi:hypothetical protein